MRAHAAAQAWLLSFAVVGCRAQAQSTPEVHQTGAFASPRVRESSGVAVSRRHAGILWTINDSGDGPFVYATDLQGRDLGSIRLRGASAEDWEDIAMGPCPSGDATCLYIADTGDNLERRLSVTVYVIEEPTPPTGPADTTRTVPARRLELVYPDGPHDVEAIYVGPAHAALYLVSKGRTGPIALFRVPRDAWSTRGPVRATKVMNLPIRPDQMIGRWVTAAASRPDGGLVAIRTYGEIFFFTVRGDGSLSADGAPSTCVLGRLEPQGEAVDFLDDSTLVVTSEAGDRATAPGPIHTVRCPG
jgi:hypothetical protein